MLHYYNMSKTDKFDLVFKALADPRRREILDLLKEGRKNTGELCDHFPRLDRCTVMLHIRQLEKADLIIAKREGRIRWNYLNVLPIREINDRWIDRIAEHSVDILSRMKHDLESDPEC